MQPFRIQPALPVQAYQTYEIRAPKETHWRPATCQEVDCDAYQNGWITTLDTATELGARQAEYIRLHSGRHYTARPLGEHVFAFTFPAGQRCFQQHHVPLEREPLYVVRGGDWRQHLGAERRHVHADDWVDDFATHQQAVADRIEKG